MKLPLIAAAQAQKHVTHNEALARLDALAHLCFLDRDLAAPPPAADGDTYLVAAGATGDWSGRDGAIAHVRDGAWQFLEAVEGLTAHVVDEDVFVVFTGGAWRVYAALLAPVATLAQGGFGSAVRFATLETQLSGLAGPHADTEPIIPDRAVVFGVSTRTVATVTGAASYDCGLAGETSKFGGSLGVAAGSSNAGVIGPTAFYADTAVRLTANGGSFTGGAVRIAVHCFLPGVPG
ncbi:hypothetical protein SL003B_2918 [Polymorphum gilvum SL003B-26A1]|uniref:Uncharacterized protein n=1 Tax=Polymorphum gilvum (strain LMG 25793 / CGMCC 1.9160 / SL003B-26A1) TaxID=991905 RepID=F2J6G7_POLGS|nr:hypothetical protein SL003B_2918 [Polymorphum gilvum SL003B-26A1]